MVNSGSQHEQVQAGGSYLVPGQGEGLACVFVGLGCDSLFLKHSSLLLPSSDPTGKTARLAQCSCWPDGCQEDAEKGHGAVNEAAEGDAGHAGGAGIPLGDEETGLLVYIPALLAG